MLDLTIIIENEYWTTYRTSKGLEFFDTQKQALTHIDTTNDYFIAGPDFHKVDMHGKSLLESDQ